MTVTDYGNPAVPRSWSAAIPEGIGDLRYATLYGDWIAFTFGVPDPEEEEEVTDWQTRVVNFRTGEVKDPYPGYVMVLGDGVALTYSSSEYDDRAYDYFTGRDDRLGDEVAGAAALDNANGAAYINETALVVRTLPFGGTSAPRVLGYTAGTALNTLPEASRWTLEADATKAIASATVQIIDGSGAVQREFDVPTGSGGSVRLSWDGTLTDGSPLPPGDYTWRLTASAVDGSGELVGIDGTAASPDDPKPAITGDLHITHEFLGTVSGPTPAVSDTSPTFGQTLTAVEGSWKPAEATFSYQWLRDGVPIEGATQKTFAIPVDAIGATLSVAVNAAADGWHPLGSAVISPPTAQVAPGSFSASAAPRISDTTPAAGQAVPLAASVQQWSPAPDSVTFDWYRVAASGTTTRVGTGAEYTPASADAGAKLKVVVTGRKQGYADTSVSSALTATVARGAFTSAPAPTVEVSGTPRIGKRIKAVPGAYVPTASAYTYQWYRLKGTKKTAIAHATGPEYTVTKADLGRRLVVRVAAKAPGYLTSPATFSIPTATVRAGIGAVTPKLTDSTPKVGQVVGITPATGPRAWTPAAVTLSYQWYRDSTAIDGSTSATYEVQAGDVGHRISVRLTATLDDYAAVTRTSAGSGKVSPA